MCRSMWIPGLPRIARDDAGTKQARTKPRSLLDERALALAERLEGLFCRQNRDLLVVIPWCLGLGRLLDLEKVHVVHLAAVDADRPLAEERIVGRQFLHLGHHGRGILALRGLHG